MNAGEEAAPPGPRRPERGADHLHRNLVALPLSRRELFTDERGSGLRASWHPDRGVVVVSLWKDDTCAGTFHLALDDAPRLAAFLDGHRRRSGSGVPSDDADRTVPLRQVRRD